MRVPIPVFFVATPMHHLARFLWYPSPLLAVVAITVVGPTKLDFCAAAIRNVQHFSATPNDGSDDTAAIQAAVYAAGPGDMIYVPAGTYTTIQRIRLLDKHDVTFFGDGRDLSILQFDAQHVVPSEILLDIQNGNQIEVADIGFDRNHTASDAGISITQGATNIHDTRVANINRPDLTPTGITIATNVSNTFIQNNIIQNITPGDIVGPRGIDINGQIGLTSNIQILNNSIDRVGEFGIHTFVAEDITIRGNQITKVDKLGIETLGTRHLIEDNQVNVWISARSSDSAVRRNTIGNPTRGLFAGIELLGRNIIVTDNTVDDGAGTPSNLGHAHGISKPHNSGPGDPDHELLFVARNEVRNVRERGLSLQDTHRSYFHQNKFNDTRGIVGGGEGIHLVTTEPSSFLVFDDNEIKGNQEGFDRHISDFLTIMNTNIQHNSAEHVGQCAVAVMEISSGVECLSYHSRVWS